MASYLTQRDIRELQFAKAPIATGWALLLEEFDVAGEGAKMVLLSAQERHGANVLLDEISYVELSDRPDFNDIFVDRLSFPV